MVNMATLAFIKPKFHAFLSTLTQLSDPQSFHEAKHDLNWCDAMNQELQALEDNNTWNLTELSTGRKAIAINGYTKPSLMLMVP